MRRSSPTILVTGSDGLVGSYVVRMLSESYRVVTTSRRELAFGQKSQNTITLNLQSANEVRQLVNIQPDIIIHLAAMLPTGTNDDAVIATNKLIDLNIFNLAKLVNASVVFCSSVSVYEGQSGPWLESLPINPTSKYAMSKLESEALFSSLDSGALSLRISSPYGAVHHLRKGVLYQFARDSLAKKRLTIYGDGNRTQDFVHALDVAHFIKGVVENWSKSNGLVTRGVLNVASGSPVSMSELALLILHLTENPKPLFYGDGDEDKECYRSHVSIDNAATLMNWKPLISLKCGLNNLLRVLEGKNEDWFAVRCAR